MLAKQNEPEKKELRKENERCKENKEQKEKTC